MPTPPLPILTSPAVTPISHVPDAPPGDKPLIKHLPWQSVPPGFVDYSDGLSRISGRLREAFMALGLLNPGEKLDEVRLCRLFVEGTDADALRAIATLSRSGLLRLDRRLNQKSVCRAFYAESAAPTADLKPDTLPRLLAFAGRGLAQDDQGMSLVDRFELLSAAGLDIYGTQSTPSPRSLSGCFGGHREPSKHTTLLHLAAQVGNTDAIAALCAAGSDFNARDHAHFTPLMRAAEAGQGSAADALLKAGANVEFCSMSENLNALHLATKANSAEIVKMIAGKLAELNKKDLLNARAVGGLAALHLAAGMSCIEALNALIESGCEKEPTADGPNLLTPLGVAARQGQVKAIAALAEARTPLDTPIVIGRSALHLAAICGQPESINALHAAKANLNLTDDHGNTALHLAVWHNKPAAVEALIRAKCALNNKNGDQLRPVDIAGQRMNVKLFEALQKAGAEGPFPYSPWVVVN